VRPPSGADDSEDGQRGPADPPPILMGRTAKTTARARNAMAAATVPHGGLQATVGWRSIDSVVVPAAGRGAMLQRHTHCPVAGHPFAVGRCYAKPLKAMKTRNPSMRQEAQVLNS